MTPYIVYRTQRHNSLLLSFPPDGKFRDIVDNFAEIGYPALMVNPEIVSFALLELVSNSIRAHREKGVADAVNVRISTDGEEFHVTVQDSGRGFDPGLLPYDIGAPAEGIDVMSDPFCSYRELHNGSRFGMGLYVAKKTFPKFSLFFVDSLEHPCPWFSGKVKGTRIDLGIPLMKGGSGVADADEVEALESLEEAGA